MYQNRAPSSPVPCQQINGGKIALEGLYVQATGEEFNPPEPVCEREMRALETLFEALHGEMPPRVSHEWNFHHPSDEALTKCPHGRQEFEPLNTISFQCRSPLASP